MRFLAASRDWQLIMKDLAPLLRSRESEFYLQFSFWPEVTLRWSLTGWKTMILLACPLCAQQTPCIVWNSLKA
jgi:hypothetical protein